MTEEVKPKLEIIKGRYLTPVEARVLGVLIEKEIVVPYKYPLSIPRIRDGCLEREHRTPVMEWIDNADIFTALESLKSVNLVIEVPPAERSKMQKYAHNVGQVLKIPHQMVLLLAVLLLKGPLTADELRIQSSRLVRFSSVDQLEEVLMEQWRRSEAGLCKPIVGKLPPEKQNLYTKHGKWTSAGRWTELLSRPFNLPRPKPTREELIHEVVILRSRLEFIEEALGIERELDTPYDETVTSLFKT